MRYALVNDVDTLSSPGQTGLCRACGKPVIAKCGSVRVHHWAHRGKRICDAWWESRMEWHCKWQDQFSREWQEVIRLSPSGEKHIADVHTARGLTIEFQYSHLGPRERAAREAFYGNMVWVVSGTRLIRDLPRFLAGRQTFRPIWKKWVNICSFPDEAFPRDWLNCTAPVFFDFENVTDVKKATVKVVSPLWCLLPGRVEGKAVILRIPRAVFIQWAHERAELLPTQLILKKVQESLMAEQEAQTMIARLQAGRTLDRQIRQWRSRRGWNFPGRLLGPGPRM